MATDNTEYNKTFDQIKDQSRTEPQDGDNEGARAAGVTLAPFQNDVGNKLESEWQLAQSEKLYDERRFIRALRQYRGQYDPEILSNIHPNRSKAFIRLTRTKVKTYDARMMDIKFPANDDKDWNLQPTPVPDLSPDVLRQFAEQITQQTGGIPTIDQIESIVVKFAADQASNMEREINDQLQEFDYRRTIREVVHSGHVYGTGVLKGPLVKEVTSKRWHLVNGKWQQLVLKRIVPTAQFVSVWDIYPEKSAKNVDELRYVWQKHLFTKNRLYELSLRSDFNGDAIRAFMEAYPEGNAEYKHYEEFLRDMSSNTKKEGDTNPPKKDKYEVHERWGYMSVADAKTLMPKVSEEQWEEMGPEVACNVWMLDNVIIKAVVSPVEGANLPYYFYYFDKDETSIFGDGIPEIMRDPQQLYNASIRAMLDNAAIAAGPIIEANIDLLADGEDPTNIFPFRVFQRVGSGIDANQQAIRVTKLPSYTNEFLGLVDFFQGAADESTTIPRALSGVTDQGMQGAAKTATGMSMLIGASNITLKDQVHFFDEGVTSKFIKAMYFWNMEFNDKNSIKGDFNVVARGSKSLIAKEVKMEQINQFLSLTNNDIDLKYIKRDVLLRELAEIFDLDKLGFIRTQEEVEVAEAQQAESQKRQQDSELILQAMQAESSGHVPDAVAKTMELFNIQLPGGPQIDPNKIQGGQVG
jgi:Ca2+-binding EF-hand superfamily protein